MRSIQQLSLFNVFKRIITLSMCVQCVQYSSWNSTAKATLNATVFIGVFEGFLVINVHTFLIVFFLINGTIANYYVINVCSMRSIQQLSLFNVFKRIITLSMCVQCVQYNSWNSTAKVTLNATVFIGVFEGFLAINVFNVFNTAVELAQCAQYSISLSTAKVPCR